MPHQPVELDAFIGGYAGKSFQVGHGARRTIAVIGMVRSLLARSRSDRTCRSIALHSVSGVPPHKTRRCLACGVVERQPARKVA
jgi:hypothetical protein